MVTVNDVISMKKIDHIPFGTQYDWLIQTVQNDLISKSNGSERVRQLLSEYDNTAKAFIIHQFMHIGEEYIANELISIFGLSKKDILLDQKYLLELVDSF